MVQGVLIERIRDENVVLWLDLLDRKAIFVVLKGQILSPFRTANYFSAKCVVVW